MVCFSNREYISANFPCIFGIASVMTMRLFRVKEFLMSRDIIRIMSGEEVSVCSCQSAEILPLFSLLQKALASFDILDRGVNLLRDCTKELQMIFWFV